MSEPHPGLPETPKELTEEVTRLIDQSRRYQTEMARIQGDLQKIQVKLATLTPPRKSSPE